MVKTAGAPRSAGDADTLASSTGTSPACQSWRVNDVVRARRTSRPTRAPPGTGTRSARDCRDSRGRPRRTGSRGRSSRDGRRRASGRPSSVTCRRRASATCPPSGTVSAPIGVAGRDAAIARHHDVDAWPSRASARGSAPTTSARPPVLANGAPRTPPSGSASHLNITIAGSAVEYDRSAWIPTGASARRPSRSESREAMELRALKERQPELADAVDMHLELLELQRRIQGRVPLPSLELSAEILTRHQAEARPLLRFEDIPLELTDLRLVVRQTADVLRRFGALDDADYQKVQAPRPRHDARSRWSAAGTAAGAETHVARRVGAGARADAAGATSGVLDQVLTLAMRPFLSRCAEVLQQRAELAGLDAPALRAVRRRARFRGDHAGGRAPPDLRPLRAALEVRAADLPVLPQQRPLADHVVCDDRRPVSRLRVRRLPPVPEGVRRPARHAAGHADGRQRRHAAARRGSDAARIFGVKR